MKGYAFITLLAAAVSASNHEMPQAPAPVVHDQAAPSPMTMVAHEVAPPAGAVTHTVVVGGVQPPADPTGKPSPMLLYTPESIKANVGDVVEFNFMQANHSATQSTFDKPCVKKADGADSGLMPNPEGRAGIKWEFPVTTTEPIWMYCKQRTGSHCGKGMVFSINAIETGDKSFAAFKQLAIAQNGTELAPGGLQAPPATPPAPASTVIISADGAAPTGGAAPPAGTPPAGAPPAGAPPAAMPTVVAGHGQAADGGACSCSCLCGANSFPSQAAVNNFGGFAGMVSPASP